MEIKINGSTWNIKIVEDCIMQSEMHNDYTLGLTKYKQQEIWLLKDQKNIIKTLKHELTHAWLYEYAHLQCDDEKIHYEEVCEIVSASNNFINITVDKFKKEFNIDDTK